jgi:hypothetical protein
MRSVRASTACLALGAIGTVGCVSLPASRGTEPLPQPAAAHITRTQFVEPELPLDPSYADEYVVRVVAGDVTCSGTLIHEDRVLTAHHCVSKRNRVGEALGEDRAPATIRVELGGDYLPWGEVGVRAVVAPPCGYDSGKGDIAILVLDRRLENMITLTPRLERAPSLGESVDPVGFGRCALSSDGIRRRARQGGKVDQVRPGRFRLQASICPGDSGGPAIGEDGGLLGVISTSAMDGSERTLGRSEFTRVDRWRPVFANAKLISEGASPAEVPPLSCGSER